MLVDFEVVKSIGDHIGEVSQTRATDSLYLRSVRVALQALKEGATVEDAFDLAETFVKRIKRAGRQRNTSSQS